ncbi:hypothetical protein ACSS6W_009046 [Trichoderma asperelloides]
MQAWANTADEGNASSSGALSSTVGSTILVEQFFSSSADPAEETNKETQQRA